MEKEKEDTVIPRKKMRHPFGICPRGEKVVEFKMPDTLYDTETLPPMPKGSESQFFRGPRK